MQKCPETTEESQSIYTVLREHISEIKALPGYRVLTIICRKSQAEIKQENYM